MNKLLPLLVLFSASVSWSQPRELWFSAGASVLWNKQLGSPVPNGAPDDVRLNDGFRFGFRFAFNSSSRIGHEIQYGYNRTRLNDQTAMIVDHSGIGGMAFHQGGYNLLYYFNAVNAESKVRPFVTGGVHFSDFALPSAAAVQGSSTKFGLNYGAGVKVRVSTLFSVRFDLRQYETGKPNWKDILTNQRGLLHQTEASAGVGISF